MIYFDTSALTKIYYPEPETLQILAWIKKYSPPLPLTSWQEIEIRTALRLKFFRGEMSATELQKSLKNLQTDLNRGIFQHPRYEFEDVFYQAEKLSLRYAGSIGCRTLDIIHVAVALIIEAKEFVTLDLRQRELAKKAGLKTIIL